MNCAAIPPAHFEKKYTPRLANKASLGDTLWKWIPSDIHAPSGDIQYILDGGVPLPRIPWNHGSTYDEMSAIQQICGMSLWSTSSCV